MGDSIWLAGSVWRRPSALVVGETIGVGIFLTPAEMAKTLGSPFWLLVVWLTMGACSMGGAICFGALAARYPEAGGLMPTCVKLMDLERHFSTVGSRSW